MNTLLEAPAHEAETVDLPTTTLGSSGKQTEETRNHQPPDTLATGHVSRSSEAASRAIEAARSDLAFNCQSGPAAPNFSGSQGNKNSTEFTTWLFPGFPPPFAR